MIFHRFRIPNFLILGAQKSGTTWLAKVLAQQSGVFIPRRKELHYFTRCFHKGPEWYAAHFSQAGDAVCLGEATPNYLAVNYPDYSETLDRLSNFLPYASFIVILREPVDRALSAYMHHVMRGRFSPEESVDTHFERLLSSTASFPGILEFGLYGVQLEEYFGVFDRRQFLVLEYERDICGNPTASAARALEFIGARSGLVVAPSRRRWNVGAKSHMAARLGGILSLAMKKDETRMRFGGLVQRGCRWLERAVGAPRLMLKLGTLRRLQAFYEADKERLRMLLGKDAPTWAGAPCHIERVHSGAMESPTRAWVNREKESP